ncbi:MAG: alanine racemase [Bacilli bacterium]
MSNDKEFEIDLNILTNNTKKLIANYSDYNYFFADLRNNAFGLGIFVVNTLVNSGINYIFVSSLNDAIKVRRYNNEIPILVTEEIDKEYIFDAINNNITITVMSSNYLLEISKLKIKDELKIHILLDNGSNKLGLKNYTELKEIIDIINTNKYLTLEGIYSELTSYGIDDTFYYDQMSILNKLISKVGVTDLIVHLNEPLMFHKKPENINGIKFDLSLFGIINKYEDNIINNLKRKSIEKKYGDLSFKDLNINLDLVFSITSKVISVNCGKKEELVGKKHVLKQDSLLGIIGIGYKSGITGSLKSVLINGSTYEIIASFLDYIIVLIDESVKVNDKVYIISNRNNIYKLIEKLNTNRYYLMTTLNSNIKRIYKDNDELKEVFY